MTGWGYGAEMASIFKKWLWLLLLATTAILVLTVHSKSQWVLGLILVPAAIGLVMRIRENYMHDMQRIRKLRGDA